MLATFSPDKEAEPELALLLALPHAALLQLAQLHQVHTLQRRARDLSTKYYYSATKIFARTADLTAGEGGGRLLEDGGRGVAGRQPQHRGEPLLCLHLEAVDLCNNNSQLDTV